MQLIVYIDDILTMAGSSNLAQEHVISLIYLLENLGFVISKLKYVLEPTECIEFLGFSVNSVQQELSLPAGKMKKSGLKLGTFWRAIRSQPENYPGLPQDPTNVGPTGSGHVCI